MQPDYIAIDGQIQDAARARLSLGDRGFLYGDAIFETLVTFSGQLLQPERHLARLRRSAEMVLMQIPWSDEELLFELKALAEHKAHPKGFVKLVVTRGDGFTLLPEATSPPRRICMAGPTPVRSTQDSGSPGVQLKRTLRSGVARGPLPKSTSYQASIVAMLNAKSQGFDDILWTNSEHEVSECSTSNIFFLQRDGDQAHLVTPAVMSGLLPGTTRAKLIELLHFAKLPCEERIIFSDELPRFDEAFVTSSVRGLTPVTRIDTHRLHSARPQAVFHHIRRLFDAWVTQTLGQRVDFATGLPLPDNKKT